jgi:hypothetical protein
MERYAEIAYSRISCLGMRVFGDSQSKMKPQRTGQNTLIPEPIRIHEQTLWQQINLHAAVDFCDIVRKVHHIFLYLITKIM